MSRPEQEPTLDIARGDVALSKHLKNSLNLLRNKADDPEFERLVEDITSGRKSLRDVFGSPAFCRVLDPLVSQAVEHYQNLSQQERDELATMGQQQFEAMRQDAERQADMRRTGADEHDDDFSDENWLR